MTDCLQVGDSVTPLPHGQVTVRKMATQCVQHWALHILGQGIGEGIPGISQEMRLGCSMMDSLSLRVGPASCCSQPDISHPTRLNIPISSNFPHFLILKTLKSFLPFFQEIYSILLLSRVTLTCLELLTTLKLLLTTHYLTFPDFLIL